MTVTTPSNRRHDVRRIDRGFGKYCKKLEQFPLKLCALCADKRAVRIIIPCHKCSELKRPLTVCSSCGVPADPQSDVSAWRLALHAQHMARITAAPEQPVLVAATASPSPREVVINIDDPFGFYASGDTAALEPLFESDGPRSFDWDERQPRFRRSA